MVADWCTMLTALAPQERMKTLILIGRQVMTDNQARLVAALSRIEASLMPVTKPVGQVDASNLRFPRECCCNALVGWEGGGGIRWQAWNDPVARKIIEKHKAYTNPDPSGKFAMLWAQKYASASPNMHVYALLEDAIMSRSVPLLAYFSMGANQIWLAQSGGEISNSAFPSVAGGYQSWQEVFDDFVVNEGVEHLLQKTKEFMIDTNFEIQLTAPDDQVIAWLNKQTGSAIAKDYYYGTGSWAWTNGGFKRSLSDASVAVD